MKNKSCFTLLHRVKLKYVQTGVLDFADNFACTQQPIRDLHKSNQHLGQWPFLSTSGIVRNLFGVQLDNADWGS